jgi:Eukaryotic aspartyl protease
MPSVLRIPINNALMGGDYTVPLSVGTGTEPVNLLLDTGSSMLVVNGAAYDPSTDPNATTTQLLQTASFMSGTFMASVVRTSVGLAEAEAGPVVTLPGANLAVTYDNRPGTFGQADGIFGLAYAALDTAYRMPADTWKNRYQASQLGLGQQADLDPYISQAAIAGLVSEKFAFAVRRSATRQVLDDPAGDPLNNGLFILGGGLDCNDLYAGPVTSVAVVHEQYYNANLLAVQVGEQTISVAPAAPGARVASNAIIDSGAGNITLDQGLYTRIIALFDAINPEFATALEKYGPGSSGGCDQSQIDLTRWPPIQLVFQSSDGGQARVTVAAQDYWQFDSVSRGTATSTLCGDNGMLAGQSNFGLPIFCGHYVVFDRTASNGQGVISFAARA